jgi:hypothetical protein
MNKGSNSPTTGVQYGTGSGHDEWDNFTQQITVAVGEVAYVTSINDCYANKQLWKSTLEFPETVIVGRRPGVIRVIANMDDDYLYKPSIVFSGLDRAMFVGYGRFNSNQIVSFIKDDYLYVSGQHGDTVLTLNSLTVEAILADPTEAPGYDESSDEFPLGKTWVYMQNEILEKLVFKSSSIEDKINNSTNNI